MSLQPILPDPDFYQNRHLQTRYGFAHLLDYQWFKPVEFVAAGIENKFVVNGQNHF